MPQHTSKSLESKTKAELLVIAKELSLKGVQPLKKADLIVKILEKQDKDKKDDKPKKEEKVIKKAPVVDTRSVDSEPSREHTGPAVYHDFNARLLYRIFNRKDFLPVKQSSEFNLLRYTYQSNPDWFSVSASHPDSDNKAHYSITVKYPHKWSDIYHLYHTQTQLPNGKFKSTYTQMTSYSRILGNSITICEWV